MSSSKQRVCPVERAGSLDSRLRRWVQNPQKILRPYLSEGMSVLDLGCGPGFCTLDIADLVGDSGSVIAADLQDGMLQKIHDKIRNTDYVERITLHQCSESKIGLSAPVDFVLAFYMVHEVPSQESLFSELYSTLKDNGHLLIVEPPVHVSKKGFEEMIQRAVSVGFEPVEQPRVFLSKTILLKKPAKGG